MVSKFYIKDKWQSVKDYFNPRQKWLTKVIPNHWCDKVELVPLLLFTVLTDFVENENGLSQLSINWETERAFVSQEYIDNVMTSYGELKETYDYIKVDRPILEKAFYDSFPEIDFSKSGTFATKEPFEIAYLENNRLEKELRDRDLKAMMTIVKHHELLWT